MIEMHQHDSGRPFYACLSLSLSLFDREKKLTGFKLSKNMDPG